MSAVSSRKEIRDNVKKTTRQTSSQVDDLINEFINLTIREINDPAWAFPRANFNHLWSFLRQKTTFSTAASTSDYVLERAIDRIALIRQTDTPVMLQQIPDDKFFQLVPNPTATGNPRFYRQWEKEGVATRLAAADTIDVVSDNANDAGSAELAVSVSGYDSSGIWRTETFALNGTTVVNGSVNFAAREVIVSKQKDTTGIITVTENSGGTTLVTLGPQERAPRFKIVTLYPTPSSAITMHVEYYTRIPILDNDSDVPAIDEKWHYIIRLGAIAKIFQYLPGKEQEFISAQSLYANAVKGMVAADRVVPDLVEHLSPIDDLFPFIHARRSEDAVA